jgi:hypothetical protein
MQTANVELELLFLHGKIDKLQAEIDLTNKYHRLLAEEITMVNQKLSDPIYSLRNINII